MKGAKDCVEAARNRILQTVGDLDSQVTIECNIEQVINPRFLIKLLTTLNDVLYLLLLS